MHARQTIRLAIQALLTGQTDCGTSVFIERESTFTAEELPAIVLMTDSEEATPRALGSNQYVRTLSINILIRVSVNDETTMDSTLDQISDQVEKLMAPANNFNAGAYSTLLNDTKYEAVADGDSYYGECTMNYQINYVY